MHAESDLYRSRLQQQCCVVLYVGITRSFVATMTSSSLQHDHDFRSQQCGCIWLFRLHRWQPKIVIVVYLLWCAFEISSMNSPKNQFSLVHVFVSLLWVDFRHARCWPINLCQWKLDKNTFDHLVLISLIWGPMNMTLIHTPVNKFTSFCDIMYSRMNQSILVKHMSIPWVWMAQNLVEAHFLTGTMFQCLSYTWASSMFMESMFFLYVLTCWYGEGVAEKRPQRIVFLPELVLHPLSYTSVNAMSSPRLPSRDTVHVALRGAASRPSCSMALLCAKNKSPEQARQHW